MNKFVDYKIYVGVVDDISSVTRDPRRVVAFHRNDLPQPGIFQPNAFTPSLGDKFGISIVLAEKTSGLTSDICPIQSYYRPNTQWEDFVFAHSRPPTAQRPIFMGDSGTGEPITGQDGSVSSSDGSNVTIEGVHKSDNETISVTWTNILP